MNKSLLNKLLVTIVNIILLYSCGLPYCKKVPFSEEDLTWIDPYTIGDTIIFQCDEVNSNDTMVIKEIDISNPPNTSIFDLSGCNWMEGSNERHAVAIYRFDIFHNEECFNCLYMIKKVCHKKPAEFYISLLGWYLSKNISTGDTITPNDNTMKYVGTIVVSDSILRPKVKHVMPILKNLSWNREKGLISYQIGDNLYSLKK